jgi:hypothetical protein
MSLPNRRLCAILLGGAESACGAEFLLAESLADGVAF